MFVLVCCWKRGSGADTGWQAKYCVWRAERSITNTDGVTGEMEHSGHKTVEININWSLKKNRTSDQLLRGGTGDWLSKKSNIIVALLQTHQWPFVNYFANPSCQASSYSLVAERIESEPNIILWGSTRNHLRFRFGDKWEKRLFISKQKEVNVAAAETSYIS